MRTDVEPYRSDLQRILAETARREADPVWRAERARRQAEEARQREQERKDERAMVLRALDLPPRALRCVLRGDLEVRPAIKAIETPAPIIVLAGGTGAGKTVAEVLWLTRWLDDERNWSQRGFVGGRAVFITAPALIRIDRYDPSDRARMERIFQVDRLVIDDLGTEVLDAKGFANGLIDELVNARYGGPMETLMSCNLTSATFAERYGRRVARRINECCRFEAVGDMPRKDLP